MKLSIPKLSEKIATMIKQANPEETASIEIMQWSLLLILHALSVLLLISLIGIFTGNFLQFLLAFFAFVILRYVTGGYHLESSEYCAIVSTALMSVVVFVPINDTIFYYLIGFSLLLVLLFAPSNMTEYSKIPRKYYPLLTLISIFMVAINIPIHSYILAKAFFVQSALLINFVELKDKFTNIRNNLKNRL